MTQVTLSQLISHLQGQLAVHGDVPVYKDVRTYLKPINNESLAKVREIYKNDNGEVDWRFLTKGYEDIYKLKRADTLDPITKGLVL